MNALGTYAIPVLVAGILFLGIIKRVPVFDTFLEGAGDGIKILVGILPSLIGLITAVEMFQASGALEIFTKALNPVAALLHIPPEVMPMAILRPISGGGSVALLDNILKASGPDSLAGRTASVMCGSSETTFYTVAVYYGSIGISKTRYTLCAALVADGAAVFFSSLAVRLLF